MTPHLLLVSGMPKYGECDERTDISCSVSCKWLWLTAFAFSAITQLDAQRLTVTLRDVAVMSYLCI